MNAFIKFFLGYGISKKKRDMKVKCVYTYIVSLAG